MQDESTNKSRMAQRNVDLTRYQRENRLLAEENERVNGEAPNTDDSAFLLSVQCPVTQ